jgi:hypothetical protein
VWGLNFNPTNQPKLMVRTTELRVDPENNVGLRAYTYIIFDAERKKANDKGVNSMCCSCLWLP